MPSPPPQDQMSRGARAAAIAALTAVSLVTLSVLAVLVVTQKHYIASNAMLPTLRMGDFVAFAPRSLSGDPQAGDVFTFEVQTGDYHSLYVMRVIGLPGDRVSVAKGTVTLNGKAVQRRDLNETPKLEGASANAQTWEETLPNGRNYTVIDDPGEGPLDDMAEVTVPADHYFVMGDNRDNANDSRAGIGTVSRDAFAGKALAIYFATGDEGIDFARIGMRVR